MQGNLLTSAPCSPAAEGKAVLNRFLHRFAAGGDQAGAATASSKVNIPAVKVRLEVYRHRALAATLVARRLAPTQADAAALDEQIGLLHFDQVPFMRLLRAYCGAVGQCCNAVGSWHRGWRHCGQMLQRPFSRSACCTSAREPCPLT